MIRKIVTLLLSFTCIILSATNIQRDSACHINKIIDRYYQIVNKSLHNRICIVGYEADTIFKTDYIFITDTEIIPQIIPNSWWLHNNNLIIFYDKKQPVFKLNFKQISDYKDVIVKFTYNYNESDIVTTIPYPTYLFVLKEQKIIGEKSFEDIYSLFWLNTYAFGRMTIDHLR